MELQVLLDYGFECIRPISKLYKIEVDQDHDLFIYAGEGSYSEEDQDGRYLSVELFFLLKDMQYTCPPYLPFGFPIWDGEIYPYLPINHFLSLLPIVCKNFVFKKDMVVSEDVHLYTLSEDQVPQSHKIHARNANGESCVLDIRYIKLHALPK